MEDTVSAGIWEDGSGKLGANITMVAKEIHWTKVVHSVKLLSVF